MEKTALERILCMRHKFENAKRKLLIESFFLPSDEYYSTIRKLELNGKLI